MEKDFPKMELDLGHIEDRESFSFDEGFGIPAPEGGELACRTAVTADVTRTGSRYLMQAGVSAVIKAECSRCLGPFEHKLETGFELIFQRGEKVDIPGGVEEEDFVLLTQQAEYCYDIFPRVRESVVLELPMRYLCGDDCRGICPGCGRNLNDEECECADEGGDPRWSALKGLVSGEDEKHDPREGEE
jgi:uncharacterized protein